MSAYVRPTPQDLTDLATVLASADWTAMKFHLSKADFNPSRLSVLTDYSADEADFDGYAAASIAFSAAHVNAGGKAIAEALVNFAASGAAHPNSLFTFYITNTAGTKLIFGGRLDAAPVNINAIGDGTSQLITTGIGDGVVNTV